jgi:hypothetical protein
MRSAVQDFWRPPRSAKAIRSRKSMFQELRARMAPVSWSRSVAMNGAAALREAPRTHST